jgi:outer membrane lipoprotein-sorting protein
MKTTERIASAVAILALLALVVFTWAAADARIARMQNEIQDLQCRHVLYEDGSSLHQDAEISTVCIDRG